MKVVLTRSPSNGEHVTSHVHSIDSEIQTWQMCYKYSSFRIWNFMMKQETFSTLNHVNGQPVSQVQLASLAREAELRIRSGVLLRVRVLRTNGYLWTPPVFHQVVQVLFDPEERYTRMSNSLLSAMVQRLLLDRIEATIYSWTEFGDPTKAGMHVHVAAFPYWDVTKISIGSHV